MNSQYQELYEHLKETFPIVQTEVFRDEFQKFTIERYKVRTRSYRIVIKDEEENIVFIFNSISKIADFKKALKLKPGI